MNMNHNIEVINENLWAVNYLHLQYIPELGYIGDPDEVDTKIACYTLDGKTVLNKYHELYPTLKNFIPMMMKKPDIDLVNTIGHLKSKVRDPYEEVYLFSLELEKNRRSISEEYVKGNKKPFNINKFKLWKGR